MGARGTRIDRSSVCRAVAGRVRRCRCTAHCRRVAVRRVRRVSCDWIVVAVSNVTVSLYVSRLVVHWRSPHATEMRKAVGSLIEGALVGMSNGWANGLLLLSLGFVLVVGVLFHVCLAKFLCLFDVRSLLLVRERLPLRPESLTDFRVVHLRVFVRNLLPHLSRPHHEGIHGSLHLIIIILALRRLSLLLGRRGRLHGVHVAVGRGVR